MMSGNPISSSFGNQEASGFVDFHTCTETGIKETASTALGQRELLLCSSTRNRSQEAVAVAQELALSKEVLKANLSQEEECLHR